MKHSPLKRKTGTTLAKSAHARVREKSVSSWKKKAWTVFSKYIRERDNYTCYTCGKYDERRSYYMHAGHFISRLHSATLFDERNVRAQCYYCNVRARGNVGIFAQKLKAELGNEGFDALLALGRTTKQFTVAELVALHDRYASLLETGKAALEDRLPVPSA